MTPSNGRQRRREATYRRGYEDGLAAAKASCDPVAYLRHGEQTFVQNVPFGAMWISDKDDPRAFPVYDRPHEPASSVAAKALELDGVPNALASGKGIWRTCTGCHESNEGYPTGPFSDTLKCHLGGGCFECGGIGAIWDMTDYEDMGNFIAASAQVQDVVGWQSMDTAPKDGTRILIWFVHPNARFSKDPVAEGWAAAHEAYWIDHNCGGWTWHGLCGAPMLWQPLPTAPVDMEALSDAS